MSDARPEVRQIQAGIRAWVLRAASSGGGTLREYSPVTLLSLLCAAAFSPVVAAGVGISGIAGAGLMAVSSVGSGVLSEIITEAMKRLRPDGETHAVEPAELEEIARQLEQALSAGDARAQVIRAEIASVLKEIDAGGTALRAAIEAGNEQVRDDIVTVIGELGAGFSELRFLLSSVELAAAEIQQSLCLQDARLQVLIDQNRRQLTEAQLTRETVAVIEQRLNAGDAGEAVSAADRRPRWLEGCPYRGLLPYDETHAAVFYGRERLTAELAGKLAGRLTGPGLIIVTGASGAGKSSLLRAGLLPALDRGLQLPGSSNWPRVVMTPTSDPFGQLSACLAALSGGTVADQDGLAQHPDQAHLAIWSAVLAVTARYSAAPLVSADTATRLVLIIDQFEQVFTLNPGPDGETTRQAFVTALCAAATSPAGPRQEPPALVVIAVRGDFWDRCAVYPEFKDALQDGFVVGPMTESEFRVAITGPADAAGLHLDANLTGTILGDLRTASSDDTTGVLPLLSQAMALTWENREDDRLTGHSYSKAGGVSNAVQTGADKAYDALSARRQELARDVFRNMTSRDGSARRPVTRNDLYTGLPRAARSDIDAILDAFAAERLVVLDGESAQISHDVLLRAWPRLRGWLEEDQASWILYGQLGDAAAAWHDGGNDSSFLVRGIPLSVFQQAVTQWSENPGRYPALTSTQHDFLDESEKAAARGRFRRRAAVAVLAVFALVASIAFVVAFQQRHSAVVARNAAVRQRDAAIYNQVVAEAIQLGTSDASLAAQLTAAAYRMQPSWDQASRLWNTENTPLSFPLASPGGAGVSEAFSPVGHILADAHHNGTIWLWNVTDPAQPRLLGKPLTTGSRTDVVVFSPDGHTLASGNEDGTTQLWDVTDPAHPRPLGQPLPGGIDITSAVAFSPDGRVLASGNDDGTTQLWDVADPAHPRPLGKPLTRGSSNGVFAVAFSSHGHVLASGGSSVRLWDVTVPSHPRPLGKPFAADGGAAYSLAFSPDGYTLASGNYNGTIRLWDVTDPAHPVKLGLPLTNGDNSIVHVVAFSPDGQTLASGNDDGTIKLWDALYTGQPMPLGQPLTSGSSSSVYTLAFSPDGHTLASGNGGGTLQLWHFPLTVLTTVGVVHAVAFSPDGHILASGNDPGTLRLWDVADPAHPRSLGQPLDISGGTLAGQAVDALAFSPDGHTLADGNLDGTIWLWDVTDPADPRLLGQPLTTSNGNVVDAVAFSRTGHTLASANYDGALRLWDVTNPARPRLLAKVSGSAVNGVAFSPDSHILATDKQLWDITDPGHPRPLGKPLRTGGGVAMVAFSPDGRLLAVGNHDGTVALWDVSNPTRPLPLAQRLTTGNGNVVNAVAFSPDGHILASGTANGTVALWDVTNPTRPLPLAQPLTTSTGNAVEALAFSLGGHMLASGNTDGLIRIWNLNAHDAIERTCLAARGLTRRQWHDYIPQLQYRALCARLTLRRRAVSAPPAAWFTPQLG